MEYIFYFDSTYWAFILPVLALSAFVKYQLTSKFKKFSKQTLSAGLSGKEIAERMLNDHGIYDVKVISVRGQLSDHYNPQKKTVNLSESVFNERNSAAAAVAAHECGHAVQHAKGYEWLKMRTILVPMVGVTSNLGVWFLIGGALLLQSGVILGESLVTIGILGFASGTLFSLITLPVEFDASKRAIYWLERKRIVNQRELIQSKEALNWAAGTYVVAALASIANLIFIWMRFGRR